MERLTKRDSEGRAIQMTASSTGRSFHSSEIWERLAEYEDTGLSPARLKELAWNGLFEAEKEKRYKLFMTVNGRCATVFLKLCDETAEWFKMLVPPDEGPDKEIHFLNFCEATGDDGGEED